MLPTPDHECNYFCQPKNNIHATRMWGHPEATGFEIVQADLACLGWTLIDLFPAREIDIHDPLWNKRGKGWTNNVVDIDAATLPYIIIIKAMED